MGIFDNNGNKLSYHCPDWSEVDKDSLIPTNLSFACFFLLLHISEQREDRFANADDEE